MGLRFWEKSDREQIPQRESAALDESAVELAYRLLLDRPPESPAIAAQHRSAGTSLPAFANMILTSPEFAERLRKLGVPYTATPLRAEDIEAMRSFGTYSGPGQEGFVTNFLGVRTRIRFLPNMEEMSGGIEGLPIQCNFHGDGMEWMGTLKAVLTASNRFVAIELGAGWGPWLVSAWKAATSRGIADVRLVGVEADTTHLEFMRTHFEDNGLDPGDHTLLLGIVAAQDGTASFPVLDDPVGDWGAAAVTHPGDGSITDYRGFRVDRVVELPAYSLGTLMEPYAAVDLVHCDIQGDEAIVLEADLDAITAKVRWLVIGTHSRRVEGEILEMLVGRGWHLDYEKPCRFEQQGDSVRLLLDGCQVWYNTSRGSAGMDLEPVAKSE